MRGLTTEQLACQLLARLLKEQGPLEVELAERAGIRLERVPGARLRGHAPKYRLEYLPPDVMEAVYDGRASLWPRLGP